MKNPVFLTIEAFLKNLMPGTALFTVFFLLLQFTTTAFISSFQRQQKIAIILLSFFLGTAGGVSAYTNTATANDDAVTTSINTAIDINVLSNDLPSESLDPTSVTIVVQPSHGVVSVNAATGVITYTPATGYSGIDNFSYQVCDNNIPSPACDIAAVKVTVTGNPGDLFIPNAFTPNNDGKNDVFKVYGSALKGAEIRIYTQWGAQIFETSDNTTGWDGKSKGADQPVGVYIYVIKIRMQDEDTFIKKGTINLIR